jgi:hypothetical protein
MSKEFSRYLARIYGAIMAIQARSVKAAVSGWKYSVDFLTIDSSSGGNCIHNTIGSEFPGNYVHIHGVIMAIQARSVKTRLSEGGGDTRAILQ